MMVSPNPLQNSVQWLVHHPLATAAVSYMTGIISVLVYSYFVTRHLF